MANKVAVVILSDPKNGSEEALGRLFNGLAAAYDFKANGDDVVTVFQGAGTRWLEIVTQAGHPATELFGAVQETVAGASCGCADVFGASESVQKSGFDLIKDNPIPGTTGLTSLRNYVEEGRTILTF